MTAIIGSSLNSWTRNIKMFRFLHQDFSRRQELFLSDWFFSCRCPRCSDPTEFGSLSSSVSCRSCGQGSVVVPKSDRLKGKSSLMDIPDINYGNAFSFILFHMEWEMGAFMAVRLISYENHQGKYVSAEFLGFLIKHLLFLTQKLYTVALVIYFQITTYKIRWYCHFKHLDARYAVVCILLRTQYPIPALFPTHFNCSLCGDNDDQGSLTNFLLSREARIAGLIANPTLREEQVSDDHNAKSKSSPRGWFNFCSVGVKTVKGESKASKLTKLWLCFRILWDKRACVYYV